MNCNRIRYAERPTISGMAGGAKSLKEVLRDNVVALMEHRYGKTNLNRLGREAKIGPGSATRIKEAKTSIGLDVLEKVAEHFKVQPWELLLPEFRPQAPQLSPEDRARVDQLLRQLGDLSPPQRDALIESDEVKRLITGPHFPVESMRGQWDASSKRKR